MENQSSIQLQLQILALQSQVKEQAETIEKMTARACELEEANYNQNVIIDRMKHEFANVAEENFDNKDKISQLKTKEAAILTPFFN